nr:MAG TPA: hypothetical protein [Caudoviricetes sp.]
MPLCAVPLVCQSTRDSKGFRFLTYPTFVKK